MPVGGNHGRKPSNPQRAPKSHGTKPKMGAPQHGRKPPPPTPRTSNRKTCCSMVAAYRAARRGKWTLARRYTVLSARLIAARIT